MMTRQPAMPFRRTLWRSLQLVAQTCFWPVTIGAVLSLATGMAWPLSLWIDKRIIDTLVLATKSTERRSHLYVIVLLVLAQVGINVIVALVGWISKYLESKAGLRLREHVVGMLMQKATQLRLERFDSPDYYNRLEMARRDAGERPLNMIAQLVYALRTTVEACGSLWILSQFSWVAVVITLASCAPGYLHQLRFGRQNWQLATDQTPEWRAMSYLTKLLTGKEAAQEVRLFGLASHLINRHSSIFTKLVQDTRSLLLRKNKTGMLLALVHSIGITGVWAAIFTSALLGKITLGAMMMYRLAAQGLNNHFQWYTHGLSRVAEDAYYLSNLFAFLDHDEKSDLELPIRPGAMLFSNYELRLEHVSFRYPGADHDVLSDVSFTVSPGEHVALVGKNGAGKSTLVKLITGLYHPTHGRILIGGVDASTYSMADRMRLFAVCLQDFCSYAFTAAEGIALGDTRHMGDLERISFAARQAGVDTVIERLPAGYNTYLGREFDATGTQLSGGQQQKIALARTFVRDEATARILILDEPTASLDPQAEQEIYERFAELVTGRSAIMITHRLGSIVMTDKVVFLEDGKVTELGTHAELMQQQGKYAELFHTQAANYIAG